MKDTNGLFREQYRINSARWAGYDYSQGGSYFITICTKNRQPYFGEIQPAANALTDAWLAGTNLATRAWECWQQIAQHFTFVEADEFVVMPDHIHGILTVHRPVDYAEQAAPRFGPQSNNLASIVRGFKVGVKGWATQNKLPFEWQSGYYDRVIRNEIELEKIRGYIQSNPNRWESDKLNELNIFR